MMKVSAEPKASLLGWEIAVCFQCLHLVLLYVCSLTYASYEDPSHTGSALPT